MNLRKYALLLPLMLWSTMANAWTLPGIGDFAFEAVTKNVYVMHGPLEEPRPENLGFMNNPGFVLSENGVIIVDPGSSLQVGEHVLAEIKKVTKKPVLAVFNTHIHGDHWLGNQAIKKAYPDVKIYGHPKMIEQANGDGGLTWIDIMSTLTKGLNKGTKVVAPGNAVDNGAVIKVDGEVFRIHHLSSAHTDTDIMIEHVGSKTMFLGDNSFYKRMGRFDDSSDMIGNIKALQHARELKMSVYVPGHGKSGGANVAITPFLDYLQKLQKSVTVGYRAEKEAHEIKKMIISDFDSYKGWSGFEDSFGKHVSKMYLEVEALEF
jgi:glyoxylase-like metal-dependent hydrolase (beta-lactamase superfamily II)